ncbi:hypothetical protein AXX17_AT1G15810 [Arabidopsis thaliana]|uniref:Uncharacterized protein n=1 Tax=Arabidopsis thaliana TaxID=3702 RepID=A0A178W4V8_ARATH|nr:hypothetical protein AXX17_AT1G15810 [Arabidopsis thaliana]
MQQPLLKDSLDFGVRSIQYQYIAMNGGDGASSYARNSSYQVLIIYITLPLPFFLS